MFIERDGLIGKIQDFIGSSCGLERGSGQPNEALRTVESAYSYLHKRLNSPQENCTHPVTLPSLLHIPHIDEFESRKKRASDFYSIRKIDGLTALRQRVVPNETMLVYCTPRSVFSSFSSLVTILERINREDILSAWAQSKSMQDNCAYYRRVAHLLQTQAYLNEFDAAAWQINAWSILVAYRKDTVLSIRSEKTTTQRYLHSHIFKPSDFGELYTWDNTEFMSKARMYELISGVPQEDEHLSITPEYFTTPAFALT